MHTWPVKRGMLDILVTYPNWKSVPCAWVVNHAYYDGGLSSLLDSIGAYMHEIRGGDRAQFVATTNYIKNCYSLHITIQHVRGIVIVGNKRAWLIENRTKVNTDRCIRFEITGHITECCNRNKILLIALIAVLLMAWMATVSLFEMLNLS
jgi:hypothetical protein